MDPINVWATGGPRAWETLPTTTRCDSIEILKFCGEPRYAAAVTRRLFDRPLDPHRMVFAMGEAIAHLNHLIRHGALTRDAASDGIDLYRRR